MAERERSQKQGRRRRLTPQEKYQIWLEVVTGQGSQREIADKWNVERSTVVHVVKLAKEGALERLAASRPGRPGKSTADLALEDALAENARLRETITEQAIELHLHRGKGLWG
ncbi:MAG: helix-turn-helix domain-containing protein [Actinomycetota bacterium]|nr:helix-turn-helix domain-containing protein [Actinomycetota bacterium]